MEKEIEVNGKKIIVKEITYLDSIDIADVREKEGLKTAITKQLIASTNLSKEEIDKLTMKEGMDIQKIVNELNSVEAQDFQNPTE